MKTTLDLPPDLLQIAAAGGISLPDLGPTPVAVANSRKLNSIVS